MPNLVPQSTPFSSAAALLADTGSPSSLAAEGEEDACPDDASPLPPMLVLCTPNGAPAFDTSTAPAFALSTLAARLLVALLVVVPLRGGGWKFMLSPDAEDWKDSFFANDVGMGSR